MQKLLFTITLLFVLSSCTQDSHTSSSESMQTVPSNNTFVAYTLADIDKIPISDTVIIQTDTYGKKDSLKNIFNEGHKKVILKFLNDYKINLDDVSVGAPKEGCIDCIGVYIKNNLWLNTREYGTQINSKKRAFIPPIPESKLDSFFVANFKFSPAMLKAGIHGRVHVGFQVYPDSTINIFQIMNKTLDIDKEIARVLYKLGKWTPAYDSITDSFVASEMLYPFPIQHPDSAKLEPLRR